MSDDHTPTSEPPGESRDGAKPDANSRETKRVETTGPAGPDSAPDPSEPDADAVDDLLGGGDAEPINADLDGADRFFGRRDGEGQRLPETVETNRFGDVGVLPMNYGDVMRYFEGDDGSDLNDLSAEQLAGLFSRYVKEPDLVADARRVGLAEQSDDAGEWVLMPGYVEDMHPLAPVELLFAIIEASNLLDMLDVSPGDDPGSVQVEQTGNGV